MIHVDGGRCGRRNIPDCQNFASRMILHLIQECVKGALAVVCVFMFRVPQLLTCLVRNEGKLILNLLSKIGSIYPQAIYFPIRTLYLTLKIEQRERCNISLQYCNNNSVVIMWYFLRSYLFTSVNLL